MSASKKRRIVVLHDDLSSEDEEEAPAPPEPETAPAPTLWDALPAEVQAQIARHVLPRMVDTVPVYNLKKKRGQPQPQHVVCRLRLLAPALAEALFPLVLVHCRQNTQLTAVRNGKRFSSEQLFAEGVYQLLAECPPRQGTLFTWTQANIIQQHMFLRLTNRCENNKSGFRPPDERSQQLYYAFKKYLPKHMAKPSTKLERDEFARWLKRFLWRIDYAHPQHHYTSKRYFKGVRRRKPLQTLLTEAQQKAEAA